MHKPGTNVNDVQMTDVLCDFCERVWDERHIFIEGHRGSVICGKCLHLAEVEIIEHDNSSASPGYSCTMCLTERDEPGWQSPLRDTAHICKRCITWAIEAITKDADLIWPPHL